MPEDKQWAADRVTILQALGLLTPEGKPTVRLEVVKTADVARPTQEEWQKRPLPSSFALRILVLDLL